MKNQLLLHSCCAPCSSYVIEYLSENFDLTLLYYNPNIFPVEEYTKRAAEQKRLIGLLDGNISVIEGEYDYSLFLHAVSGLESEREGGKRCEVCFELRLREAAAVAKARGIEYFTTTLSVSPHKDADALNAIGAQMAEEYNVKYLYANFKKKNGYKRSIELSRELGLYRQSYCGCEFSKII